MRDGTAVVAVAAAVLLRMALTSLIGPTAVPFITFFPAVLLVAWFAGFGPSALCILLSVPASDYFFIEPVHTFLISHLRDHVALAVFVVVSFGMALLSNSQQRAQDALERERERLALALSAGRLGAYQVDPGNPVRWWSPEMYALMGMPQEFTPTRDAILALVHPDDREPLMEAFEQSIKERRRLYHEFRIVRNDGSLRWAGIWGQSEFEASGRWLRHFGVASDITDRKQAEQQRLELLAKERALASERALRETQAELARVGRALSVGELATSIAHEVNQPLAGVVTNAEAALRWLGGEPPNFDEARQSLALIVRDGNRAAGIIRRIRQFLAKDGERMTLLEMNDVIEEAIALARPELAKRAITLLADLTPHGSLVRGDRIQLQQVIVNLVLNAAEAMESAGAKELAVTSSREASGIAVAVRDSGVGMPNQDPVRMFEPFFTTKPNGMGMGLSISRSIVEAHGGSIWAESNDGPGLTVRFRLPVEGGDDSPSASSPSQ